MEVKTNIKKTRTLKDFTRLLIGFVCCLFALSIYQQLSLYYSGVIDRIFNKTIVLLAVNHLGFAAMLSFILLFLFRFLERSKSGLGFRVTLILFALLLMFEAILVENFSRNYSLLHFADFQEGFSLVLNGEIIFKFGLLLLALGLLYFLFYKLSWFLNAFIGKMYPFTIILFLLVLGTSVTNKRPINQNKSMDFITEATGFVINFNKYEGVEYPLLRDWEVKGTFTDYFETTNRPPNIVIIVVDGLSGDFITDGLYAGFTPFLDSIAQNSLYWKNFVANSTSSIDAVPNILGSLPQGKNGFTTLEHTANRNTLFGILKANGYQTGFYYGGNASLKNLDKFLSEEDVDVIIDKSRFNDTYKLQDVDRAGVTLGYPDGELFKKWGSSYFPSNRPRAEFFLNLSTSRPFSIPNSEKHIAIARDILKKQTFSSKEKRFVDKNIKLFASLTYADASLKKLFKMYALTKDFDNTVFVITGSGKSYIPNKNMLKAYHVPLLVSGNLVKDSKVFENIASHHDIAPSLLDLTRKSHEFELPRKTAWLGRGLLKNQSKIVLSTSNDGVKALVHKNHFIEGRSTFKIKNRFELYDPIDEVESELQKELKDLKAINIYVTSEDKIIPNDYAIYETGKKRFSKEEMVWISSVFNGKNYDNAYNIARKLAHEGNYDKSLVLSSYILENAPGHIDAMILQGRIHAWKKHYNKSISILEKAVDLHPFYHDGYSALLDVYYWSGNNFRASHIYEKIKENHIETTELVKKVERCMNQIKGIVNEENNRLVDIQLYE